MKHPIFYTAGGNEALHHAALELAKQGYNIVPMPSQEVTHLLIPAPGLEKDGRIRGGGSLEQILEVLPANITIIGGQLDHPALHSYRKLDLLSDELYLAENAAITADCAIRIAVDRLPVVLDGCPVLVIGWGRIGKCLASLLKAAGAKVTTAARKSSDRAMLRALGYEAVATQELEASLRQYRVIFNTVPERILTGEQTGLCQKECKLIDLASVPGIEGGNVIWARGLPGKMVPESSGKLMAETIIRKIEESEAEI